jgi:phospholipid transport system substrate-binding protein
MKIRTLFNIFALAFAGIAGNAFAAATPPDELVKTTASEVLTIIKQDKDIQSGNTQKVVDLVDAKVLPHFDFQRMTRLAVGRNWTKATDAQKEQLVKEFRMLLVRTYSTSLAQYKNQTIDYKPVRIAPEDKEVTVKTAVNQPGAQPIAIDYRMELMGDAWKVFDIAVDGVSLVTNYRSSFASIADQQGIDGLIKSIADKNKSNTGNTTGK